MALIPADIRTDPKLAARAKALYLSAFPKEERLPWWLMRLNALRRGIDLTAWMEGETFCGFTASVTEGNMHFLLFFAVDGGLRGRGYGSKILDAIRREHGCVSLNVELLDPKAENYEQRKLRFAFYGKNGFYDTYYHVWEVGGKFRVLSTCPELDVQSYKSIFKKLSLGVWNVRLEKAGKET